MMKPLPGTMRRRNVVTSELKITMKNLIQQAGKNVP